MAIEYHPGSVWLYSVTIYPSVHASNYNLTYPSVNNETPDFSNPSGMNGGICGLTKIVESISSGFWYRENNRSTDACGNVQSVSSAELTKCLVGNFSNYWKYAVFEFKFFATMHAHLDALYPIL